MPFPRSVWHWAFYDFANSAYLLIFTTFLLPVYFTTVLGAQGMSLSTWGFANGLSTLHGVGLAIVLGRYADRTSRIRVFMASIIGSFVGMVAISAAIGSFVAYVPILFVLTNALFILSLSLSDSILPYVASTHESYEFSGFAWGFGYLGGIVSLIVVLFLQKLTSDYSPLVFLSVAVFYLIFSFYALHGLRGVPLNEPAPPVKALPITPGQKALLLLGYFLISECITVIVVFISIFLSREVGLSTAGIGLLFLVIQLIAFPATWIGGRLASRDNVLWLLGIAILLWGMALLLLIFSSGLFSLMIVTLLGGLAVGNSQSYLRAQYNTVIHKSESGFQFGLYSIVSEGAVFIGPIVFGIASDTLGSQKIPLLGLFVMMVLGYLIVVGVMRKVEV